MNSNCNTPVAYGQSSQKLCSIHDVPMVMILGREVCKRCAADTLLQSQHAHAQSLQDKVQDKRIAAATIPPRHANCGFKNYRVDNQGQQQARDICIQFAKDFNAGKAGNLMITGRTGTGKTHLACAMIRNILDGKHFAKYITSEDMANHIASAWHKADDSEMAAITRFSEYELLIIDEYGLHDQHENRLKLVHKVLYSRYDAQKPTVLISNFTLDELQKNLGDRLWSRLQHDGLTQVACNWNDARLAATDTASNTQAYSTSSNSAISTGHLIGVRQ